MLEIFLSPWGIGSIIVAAILFIVWRFFCVREISAVNVEIKNFLAWLETEREFQDIDAELKNYNRLLPVWKNFEKSLTKTSDVAYSTTDAADFFSTQNLTHGMNMTFWQAYGGIFTGLGILGTFAGLTYGLSGVDMTSGDIETLKNGIAKLLSGVESAFVTSLVGIFCAIIYSVVHHLLMKDFQGKVKLLAERLDEIFPRRSAEDWLAKNCKITDDQTNSIKEIGEVVTQAIYEGLDEKLGEAIEKLDPLVEKICEAIENLGAGGTDTVGEIFSDRVGAQMDRFSVALDKFTNSIDDKLKASDELSKIMNEQLLQRLNELNEALKQDRDARDKKDEENNQHHRELNEHFATLVKNLLADLKEFIERQKEFLDKVANTNTAQISEAVEAFRAIVDRHNQTTQKTFAQVQTLLDETEKYLQGMEDASTSLKQAAEPVKQSTLQLTRNLEETSAQMKNLSAANQATRQNLFDLTARLSTFVNDFKGIADELERSTKIIYDSLDNYNAKTNAGLKEKLEAFDKSMAESVGYLKSLLEDLTDALEDSKQIRRR